jgi:hypothetical protein
MCPFSRLAIKSQRKAEGTTIRRFRSSICYREVSPQVLGIVVGRFRDFAAAIRIASAG